MPRYSSVLQKFLVHGHMTGSSLPRRGHARAGLFVSTIHTAGKWKGSFELQRGGEVFDRCSEVLMLHAGFFFSCSPTLEQATVSNLYIMQ